MAVNAERDPLLAEESSLGDEVRFVSEQVGGYGECQRRMSRLGEREESPFEKREETVAELAERVGKMRHVVGSLEKLSEAIKRLYPGFSSGQVASA